MTSLLRVGDRAPDFELPSQTGEAVRLSSFFGSREVVLYFYPKDNSPGCTTEAKAFRDSYEVFKDMGAEVIGVSSDSVDSHRSFVSQCSLPFALLSDSAGNVRKTYGVPSSLGLIPGRVSFVIDRAGTIRHVFNSQMNPAKHVEEAVKVVRALQAKPAVE